MSLPQKDWINLIINIKKILGRDQKERHREIILLQSWKRGKLLAVAPSQSLQRNLRILNLIYSCVDVGSSVHLLFMKYCTQILIHRGRNTV